MTTEEQRAKWREAHQRNREKRLARMREYHAAHREEHKAYMRQRHQRIREVDNPRRLAHHYANQEHANQKRKINLRKSRKELPWKYMLKSAADRAKQKGVPFFLTEEWAANRWTGHCELTGIQFAAPGVGQGPKMFSPSLDRIVPSIGYTPENCRFVLWGVNALKGTGTDADMMLIAKALTEKHQ